MVCGYFILPEPASYVFFYAIFNLRNLFYLIENFFSILKAECIYRHKPLLFPKQMK